MNKFKALKGKIKEKDKIQNLNNDSEKNRDNLKVIKKMNKSPNGVKNLKNKQGNIVDIESMNKIYISGKVKYQALKNVSFSIKKGDFVVILGPSGSGKTTLLNVLSGLDRATDGDIVINNINISALKNSELTTFRRHNVGFVFQSYNLLSELNVKDNAEIGRQLQISNNKRLDIKELLEKVGLEGYDKKSVNELSGGQSQRVSIIRALSKNPSIIFADEPTGALDSETSKKVLELFKTINEKYKTTIIFVTHDESISKLANKILRVKDGRVTVQENG